MVSVSNSHSWRCVATACLWNIDRSLRRLLGDGACGNLECISNFYQAIKDCKDDSVADSRTCNRKRIGSVALFCKRMVEKMKTQYQKYVNEKTPKNRLGSNMVKAFLTGGIICTIGEGIQQYCKSFGLGEKTSGAWVSLILVLLSVILTGLNIYPKIAKWGGAGALVPITGFANSVAAPAIEYKKEGQVFGIGCKIFTIAGPVILYGIVTSWFLGLLYWIVSAL